MTDAFMAGAAGFVIKDITGLDLVGAVRTVGSGRSLLDPRAVAVLMNRLRSALPASGPLAVLNEHERTTLDLIGEGLSNRQIAERMFVAEKTVKNYVSHVPAKLGMASRTEVAVLATQVRDSASTARDSRGPGRSTRREVIVNGDGDDQFGCAGVWRTRLREIANGRLTR